MMKHKRLTHAIFAACLAALAAASVFVLMTTAGAASGGKNGVFLGSPAHVDGKGNLIVDEVNFPDIAMLAFAASSDTNKDGALSTGEARTVKRLTFSGGDLSGVEFFTELTYLDCSWCGLTTLDLSANKKLSELNCSVNSLASVSLSANTALSKLDVSLNPGITSLDLSKNTALTELDCSGTGIVSLSLRQNTKLSRLVCGDDPALSQLDLSANTSLSYLDCGNSFYERGALASLDLSKNTRIAELDCSYNSITALSLSSSSLKTLDCSNNSIASLDLSRCASLEYLECSDNLIETLDLPRQAKLTYLYCDRNRLLSVDLSHSPLLETASLCGQTSPVDAPMAEKNGKFTADLSGLLKNVSPSSVKDVTGEYLDDVFTGTFDPKELTAAFTKNALYVTYSFDVPLAGGGVQSMSVKAKTGPAGTRYIELTNKNVPDGAFREYLRTLLGADKNGRVDENEIKRTTVIDCSGLGIKDLTGISLFTELSELDASENALSALDLRNNKKLVKLDCSHNELTELNLPVMKGIYGELDCSYNKLTSLRLKNEIRKVDCSHNELTSLSIGGEYNADDIYGGYYLNCSYNKLAMLDGSVAHGADVYSGNTTYTYVVNGQEYAGTASVSEKGGAYTLDLSPIVGSGSVSAVTSVKSKNDPGIKAEYDAKTGVATFDKYPGDVVYTVQCFYKNNGSSVEAWGPEMDVAVNVVRRGGVTGDANGDGVVNNADVLAIFRYVFDSSKYPLKRADLADADGNGRVDNRDALAIFRYIFNSSQYPL